MHRSTNLVISCIAKKYTGIYTQPTSPTHIISLGDPETQVHRIPKTGEILILMGI